MTYNVGKIRSDTVREGEDTQDAPPKSGSLEIYEPLPDHLHLKV